MKIKSKLKLNKKDLIKVVFEDMPLNDKEARENLILHMNNTKTEIERKQING